MSIKRIEIKNKKILTFDQTNILKIRIRKYVKLHKKYFKKYYIIL